MATINIANSYGALDEQRLLTLEKKIGVSLPNDYREFLIQFNGGEPVPEGVWIIEDVDGSCVHEFFGLHDDPKLLSLDCINNSEFGLPESLLPIAGDGLGDYVCLKVTGDDFGAIFFVDHEQHSYEDRESFEGIIRLKESFSEFISSLQVIEE